MALTINLVDYSPLYNALGAQRAAGQLEVQRKGLELRQKDISRQATADLLQLASDAAKTVYRIFQEGALEKTKKQVIENETWYSQQIQKGLSTIDPETGQYKVTFKDGELIIPDDLQAEYDSRQAAIEKQVAGYPEVHAWASDQGALIKQRGILHAMSVAEPIARATREALGKETLTTALDQSVAQGKLDPYYAALAGQTWRPSEEKALLRQLGEQDFGYRTKEGGIRNLVAVEGYDAGATAVEAWRKSGEVTSEQADALLTTAANQGKVQEVVFAQQAQAAYQKMVEAGGDPEAAVKIVVKGIPEAYRSQTEELLRAAAETAATRADNVADEKMQDYFAKHPDDPAGLRAYLDLPANDFSKAMKRDTYMSWHNFIDSMLQRGKGKGKEPMTAGEAAGWDIIYKRPNWTTPMRARAIRDLVNSGRLDPITATEIAGKLSLAEKWTNPIVLDAVERIDSTFRMMAEKEKDPLKNAQLRRVWSDAMANMEKTLGEGPYTDAQINGAADAFLKPYKADLLKSDWWNPATRTDVDVMRAQGWLGVYIPPDQQAAFERYDRDMLETTYGVGKKAGTAILNVADATRPSDTTGPGASYFKMYLVTGLNPKHPKDAFYYAFQTDPATRTERLMVLEEIKNTQGQTIGANWMPATFVKTLTEQGRIEVDRKKAEDQAAREAAAISIKKGGGTAAAVASAAGAAQVPISTIVTRATERAAQLGEGLSLADAPVVEEQIQKAARNKKIGPAAIDKIASDWYVSAEEIMKLLERAGVTFVENQ